MKRLPKPRLLKGLIRKGLLNPNDKEGIRLIESRLADKGTYHAVNKFYQERKGNKFVDRFRSWLQWVWKYRTQIAEILGILIMFADDGTPIIKDARAIEPEEEGDAVDETPDGEKVIDFVEPLVVQETVMKREDVEKSLDAIVKMNQESGQYDLGINPLIKENDEVQSQESDNVEADGRESDDLHPMG